MSQLQLMWGQGSTTAVLDIRSGEIYLYNGSAEFHSLHGGQCTSRSRSGCSGRGWIPRKPWLKEVGVYRTDVSTSGMFCKVPKETSVAGSVVLVPYNYKLTNFKVYDFPVIVIKGGTTYLVQSHDVIGVLSGRFLPGTKRTVEYTIVPMVGAEPVTHEFDIVVGKGVKNVRRVVEGLHYEELRWREPERPRNSFYGRTEPFWGRLGLQEIEGRVYKMYCGICRGVYNVSDLSTVEALQAVAPANVTVLTPDLYIQEQDGTYVAILKVIHCGETLEIENGITPEEGVKAITGDFFELERRMKESERQWLEHLSSPRPAPNVVS